jgi:hypothetical protein
VIAVFTAPFSYLVDFLFTEILHAPTADQEKANAQESIIVKTGRRMSATARRVSNAGIIAGTRMLNAAKKTRTSFINRGRERVATMMQFDTTIVAPDTTVEAHREATTYVKEKLDQFKSENSNFEERRITLRQRSTSQRFSNVNRDSYSLLETGKKDDKELTIDEKAQLKYDEFDGDFQAQRATMEEYDREELDRIWE